MSKSRKQLHEQLWAAAEQLRANSSLKLNEMSEPILGLIFLKFADVRFKRVQAEFVEDRQDQDRCAIGGRIDQVQLTESAVGYVMVDDDVVFGTFENGAEIAETLVLPKALQDHLNVRGYYGTVRHNVRAIYQHYLGWFDAHPANLDALPPLDAARQRTIERMRRGVEGTHTV
jgi:hypothetical protein